MRLNYIRLMMLGVIIILVCVFGRIVFATTNISSDVTKHWAWNDPMSWIDFYNTNTITVGSRGLTGYASSTVGDISLDCHTTRNGNICAQSNYQVLNDGSGNLSGWAWNDQYGWINFYCGDIGVCSQSNYETYINGSTGDFSGWAWNDVAGWISFCGGSGTANCPGAVGYKVNTSWTIHAATGTIDSVTFDTGQAQGAVLQSVLWLGSAPAGTAVKFQFAGSNNDLGPWNYMGSDGTSSSFYNALPGVTTKVDQLLFNNYRYFRYRVQLTSNLAQTASPRVDEIILHWSP